QSAEQVSNNVPLVFAPTIFFFSFHLPDLSLKTLNNTVPERRAQLPDALPQGPARHPHARGHPISSDDFQSFIFGIVFQQQRAFLSTHPAQAIVKALMPAFFLIGLLR